jgi:ERF superfamily
MSELRSSDTIGKLTGALTKAQANFGPVVKNRTNKNWGYTYADIDSIIISVRKALTDQGLALTQYTREEGDNTFLVTELLHTSDEWISGELRLILTKRTMQELGSAMTYARRYGASALLGISAEEDDDANLADGKPNNPDPDGIIHDSQEAIRMDTIRQITLSMEKNLNLETEVKSFVLNQFKKEGLKLLTHAEAVKTLHHLNEFKKRAK